MWEFYLQPLSPSTKLHRGMPQPWDSLVDRGKGGICLLNWYFAQIRQIAYPFLFPRNDYLFDENILITKVFAMHTTSVPDDTS